jgi:hypothetical protein
MRRRYRLTFDPARRKVIQKPYRATQLLAVYLLVTPPTVAYRQSTRNLIVPFPDSSASLKVPHTLPDPCLQRLSRYAKRHESPAGENALAFLINDLGPIPRQSCQIVSRDVRKVDQGDRSFFI